MGHACRKMGRSGGRLDSEIDMGPVLEGKRDYSPHENDEAADGTLREENPEARPAKSREISTPYCPSSPANTEGIVVIRGNSKTERSRKAKKTVDVVCCPETTGRMVVQRRRFTKN